jgi:hypothetical protein
MPTPDSYPLQDWANDFRWYQENPRLNDPTLSGQQRLQVIVQYFKSQHAGNVQFRYERFAMAAAWLENNLHLLDQKYENLYFENQVSKFVIAALWTLFASKSDAQMAEEQVLSVDMVTKTALILATPPKSGE